MRKRETNCITDAAERWSLRDGCVNTTQVTSICGLNNLND